MKKFLHVCLSLLMMIGLCNMQLTKTKAATIYEEETNDTAPYADTIGLNDTVYGEVSNSTDYDLFKITIPSQGKLSLDVTSYIDDEYYIKILDINGNEIWYSGYQKINERLGSVSNIHDIYLEKGMYYVMFTSHAYDTGKYFFSTKFTSSNTTDGDDNNTYATATNISLGQTRTGQISSNDDLDIYKVSFKMDGYLCLDLKAFMENTELEIHSSAGEVLWSEKDVNYVELLGYSKNSYKIKLSKGTYYVVVKNYEYAGKYNLKANYAFTISKPKTTVHRNSTTSIKVGWNKIKGASGYVVYRATSKKGKYTKIATVGSSARSYVNKNLKTGKTYYYRVKAYKNVESKKYYSGMNSGVGCKVAPKKVTGLKTTSRLPKSISLSWTKQSGVSGYEVYRSDFYYGKFSRIATVSSNKFTNKKRTPNTNYYYKVRAYKTVDGKKVYGSFSSIHDTWTRK